MKPSYYRESYPWLFIILLVIIGAALRLDFMIAYDFVPDSDEAIVGLMAKHIMEGADVPTFYYGQHYMGSFEPFLVSLLFKFFGYQTELLKIVPLIFSLLLILALGAIGYELGGRKGALITALITAIPPSTLVVWSGKARGGFIELVFIGAFVTLSCFWWVKSGKFDFKRLAIISFLLGFGWWTNNQIVYFYPAVGLILIWLAFKTTKTFFQGLKLTTFATIFSFCFWILGGLPFWLYNLNNDFASFKQLLRDHEATLSEHLIGFFQNSLPILLGGKRDWHVEELFPYSSLLSVLLYALPILIALLFLLFDSNQKIKPKVFYLFILLITSATVFILSPYGYLSEAPRYLLPIYVAIIPLAGFGISLLYNKKQNTLASTIIFGILALNLSSSYLFNRAVPGEPFVFSGERVSRDHQELYDFLKSSNIKWIRTNYWIGYRIAYETAEEIKFLVFQDPYQRRIEQYEIDGAKEGLHQIPLVLVPKQAEIVKQALDVSGYKYRETIKSGYVIFYDLVYPIPEGFKLIEISPSKYKAIASDHNQTINNAYDGDLDTRWGSGRAQSAGMQIEFMLDTPQIVRAIDYHLGAFIHDYPRELAIYGIDEAGNRLELIKAEDHKSLRFLVTGDYWRIYLPKIPIKSLILVQEGTDPVFDWSIAEIKLLEKVQK